MEHYLRSAALAVLLLLLQATFIPFIGLSGILPDLFLLWLVFVALRHGQLEVTLTGFGAGLLQDIVSTKFLGLAALSKTIAAFLVGYFFNENTTEQTLGSYRYVLIVALCSLIHNSIYYAVFLQGSDGPFFATLLFLVLATAFYTTILSVIPMFVFSQRYSTSWAQ